MRYWKAIRAACAEYHRYLVPMSQKRIAVIRHLMSHLRVPIINTGIPIPTSGSLRLTFAFVNSKMARSAWEYSGRSPG